MKPATSRFRNTLCAALLVAAAPISLAVSPATAAASTATFGIYDADCNGQDAAHIIKSYPVKGGAPAPLRCGTSRYGYIHIRERHGFLADTEGKIAYALKNHQSLNNDSPTSTTYFTGPIKSGYRVVVEQKAYSDGRGQGIITAY